MTLDEAIEVSKFFGVMDEWTEDDTAALQLIIETAKKARVDAEWLAPELEREADVRELDIRHNPQLSGTHDLYRQRAAELREIARKLRAGEALV